jgi:2-keto-4-pentenoate hydratase/2-oxohepta-3-ene-1,7-dioic acid hydratase in catechol pathway
MKIVRYSRAGREQYGALEGDGIEPIEGELGAFRKTARAKSIPRGSVSLLAPVAPGKIVAAGLNYGQLVRDLKVEPPAEPLIFIKPSTAVIGPDAAIVYPPQTRKLYYEGELAIVIARRASKVPRSEARRYVLGYTCMNDVTAVDLQDRDHEFTRSKSFDTFAPLGPVIETEIENPDDLALTARLNGKLRQNTRTSDLIFKCDFLVSFISHIMTLLPGDVISTGTPPGLGEIKPGDVIEIEVEGIGKLINPVAKRKLPRVRSSSGRRT